MSFSRRVVHMDPWPPLMHVSDVTGYPLTHPHVLRQDATPPMFDDLASCPSRARSPGLTGTTDDNGQKLTGRHQNTSLLNKRYRPDLCTAVIRPGLALNPRLSPTPHWPGLSSRRTRVKGEPARGPLARGVAYGCPIASG
jgi:hypothetical protein